MNGANQYARPPIPNSGRSWQRIGQSGQDPPCEGGWMNPAGSEYHTSASQAPARGRSARSMFSVHAMTPTDNMIHVAGMICHVIPPWNDIQPQGQPSPKRQRSFTIPRNGKAPRESASQAARFT